MTVKMTMKTTTVSLKMRTRQMMMTKMMMIST
jgi:hypothetical protein